MFYNEGEDESGSFSQLVENLGNKLSLKTTYEGRVEFLRHILLDYEGFDGWSNYDY